LRKNSRKKGKSNSSLNVNNYYEEDESPQNQIQQTGEEILNGTVILGEDINENSIPAQSPSPRKKTQTQGQAQDSPVKKPTKHLDESRNEEKEEKDKIKMRRQSKYSILLSGGTDTATEEKLKQLLKEHSNNQNEMKRNSQLCILAYRQNRGKPGTNSNVLKFTRGKSKEQPPRNFFKEEDMEDAVNKITLGKMLRTNFEKNKIKNLESHVNQESIGDNRFKRDKSATTQGMNKLKEKINQENYNDAEKLSRKVFEDFEKQTSWQSYTTLLITDIVNDGQANNLGGKMNNSTINKTQSYGAHKK
jgi:hypothetical protein